MMVGLVRTINGHMTWFDYHIEASSSPPEEIDKNMVDEDRLILMREKMNMHVYLCWAYTWTNSQHISGHFLGV